MKNHSPHTPYHKYGGIFPLKVEFEKILKNFLTSISLCGIIKSKKRR